MKDVWKKKGKEPKKKWKNLEWVSQSSNFAMAGPTLLPGQSVSSLVNSDASLAAATASVPVASAVVWLLRNYNYIYPS